MLCNALNQTSGSQRSPGQLDAGCQLGYVHAGVLSQRRCSLGGVPATTLQQPFQHGRAFVVQELCFPTQRTIACPHVPDRLQSNTYTSPIVRHHRRSANQGIIDVQQDCAMALLPDGALPPLCALVTMPTIRMGLAAGPFASKRSATRLEPSVWTRFVAKVSRAPSTHLINVVLAVTPGMATPILNVAATALISAMLTNRALSEVRLYRCTRTQLSATDTLLVGSG